MKKYATILLFPILFLAGLSLLLYPLVSNEWNNYRQSRLISDYDEAVAEQTAAGAIDYHEEWTQAASYNESLKPYVLPDSFASAEHTGEADEAYLSCLNLTGNGMMGYVQIPKINVKIPIYHTVEEKVLQTAAGHLEGSSLPVGGEGTHAVISAHRGLPSAALFTDLDRLAEGDCFLLYILDDVLCYKVDQISVVEPEDTSTLAAEDGKDLVTLLTCTPYGVNSHRLLVRGYRVPYEEIEDEDVAATSYTGPSLHTNYALWVMVGLSATGLFILLCISMTKEQKDGWSFPRGAGSSTDRIYRKSRPADMKRTLINLAFGLLFLTGFGILAYPTVSDQWNTYRQSRLISTYEEAVSQMKPEDYSREWETARAFNDTLEKNNLYGDAFGTSDTDLTDTQYWTVLNAAGDGIMGYLSIPKINIRLAVYHGVGEEVLQTGIGHLDGTKLPIGGESTHSVLAAHRGLPSARLFTDVDQLARGDRFYIHILDEILAYEVDQILPMVDKDDMETLENALQIAEGEDHVTLFTCTPYGVNSHRLLVRGTRVPYEGEEEIASTPVDTMLRAVQNYYMLYLILGLSVTVLVILVMRFLFRPRKKKDGVE